jgi:lysophospholipid acyltransferase (LPLAT)-like uncharacterized protein
MLRRAVRHPASQAVLAWMGGLYLWFALRTTRWTLVGAKNLEPYALGAPGIMAAWHERLPLLPMLWLMIRHCKAAGVSRPRMRILVSRSRDGRFIAALVRRFGINVALGSSSGGGAIAMRSLMSLIAAGDHIGITPDGPRGPRRRAAPGVAQLAALSGTRVLPCAAQSSRHWVLQSWDQMIVPKPFGRAVIVCGTPIHVPREGWRNVLPAIEHALTEVAKQADQLCGVDY